MAKPLSERLAAAKARKEKADARLRALEGKAATLERKKDTRRKIIVGGAVLAYMRDQPDFAAYMAVLFDRVVSRELDRAAIADLLPPSPAAPVDAVKQA